MSDRRAFKAVGKSAVGYARRDDWAACHGSRAGIASLVSAGWQRQSPERRRPLGAKIIRTLAQLNQLVLEVAHWSSGFCHFAATLPSNEEAPGAGVSRSAGGSERLGEAPPTRNSAQNRRFRGISRKRSTVARGPRTVC